MLDGSLQNFFVSYYKYPHLKLWCCVFLNASDQFSFASFFLLSVFARKAVLRNFAKNLISRNASTPGRIPFILTSPVLSGIWFEFDRRVGAAVPSRTLKAPSWHFFSKTHHQCPLMMDTCSMRRHFRSLSLSPSLSRAASTSAQPYGKIGPRFVASKFQLLCLHDDGVLLRSPPWGSELSNGSFASLQTATCLLCSSWEPVRDCCAVPCVLCSFVPLARFQRVNAALCHLVGPLPKANRDEGVIFMINRINFWRKETNWYCTLVFISLFFGNSFIIEEWKIMKQGMMVCARFLKVVTKSGHVLHVGWWKLYLW